MTVFASTRFPGRLAAASAALALLLSAAVAPAQDISTPASAKRSGWFKRTFRPSARHQTLFASAQTTLPAAPSATQQQPAPAPAQQAPPQPPATTASPDAQQPPPSDDITTIKVQANEVNLVFAVTDKKGKFVPGLKQENFGLLDDHRDPVRISKFTLARNLPLRVGVMLDTSSSIRGRFAFEQDSAVEFFLQVLHTNDRAFIEGFDLKVELAQGFTNSIDALNTGVHTLRPGGGTALFDALYSTCHNQMLTLRDAFAVRRALILVSDGDDNYSHALQSDAIKECQRADTIVYAISTNISPSKDKGDDVLKQIAEATGGQAFFPIKIEDVAVGFRSIEEELRSQYSLIYTPADFKNDGSFRTIYLQALDKRYFVRAKKGYFAPRAPQ